MVSNVVITIISLIVVETVAGQVSGELPGDTKVVNGNTMEFPYVVALIENGELICTGSLIRSDIVLTAAQCKFTDVNKVTVHAGSIYLEQNAEDNIQVQVIDKFIKYENFTAGFNYDVALAKTKKPFDLNEFVGLAQLPNSTSDTTIFFYPHYVGVGWGRTAKSENISDILRNFTVYNIERGCIVDDHEICFSEGYFRSSSSSGYSGAPIIHKVKENVDLVVAVVISHTSELSENGYAFTELYRATKVTFIMEWISMKLNQL